MNADLRGYDSLSSFKKIAKLTKGESYLCDLCNSMLDGVQIAGAFAPFESFISTLGLCRDPADTAA